MCRNNFHFLFLSLLTLELSLLYKTRVAMQFPAKITLSYIWVAIPVHMLNELFYIGMPVVQRDGQSVVWSMVM